MMKSLILLFLTVFFAICIKAASPSYNNFDTNSFLISGVTNGIPYVAVPIISVKNGGSGGATYSFYNTNLPAGFLVTNAATVGIGTNAPSSSETNVTADNIDNSGSHTYTATNPANQFTGTFNGNATTALYGEPGGNITTNLFNEVSFLDFCGTNTPHPPMLVQDNVNAHGWFDQSSNIQFALKWCATNTLGKTTLFLPPGIYRVASGNKISVPPAVNIKGVGYLHYGIEDSADLPTTNYSMIWFDNTNATGVWYDNITKDVGSMEDIQIEGFTNPVAPYTTLEVAPFAKLGIAGLTVCDTNIGWSGGFTARNVSVSGFRIGVAVNSGLANFDHCVWILNGIGLAATSQGNGYETRATNAAYMPTTAYYWSNCLSYFPSLPAVSPDQLHISDCGGGFRPDGLVYWLDSGRAMEIDHDTSYAFHGLLVCGSSQTISFHDSYMEAYEYGYMATNPIILLGGGLDLDNVYLNNASLATNTMGDYMTNASLVDIIPYAAYHLKLDNVQFYSIPVCGYYSVLAKTYDNQLANYNYGIIDVDGSTVGLHFFLSYSGLLNHYDFMYGGTVFHGDAGQMNMDNSQYGPTLTTNLTSFGISINSAAYGVPFLQRGIPDYLSMIVRSNSIGSGVSNPPYESTWSPTNSVPYWVRFLQSDYPGNVTQDPVTHSFNIEANYTVDQMTVRSNLLINGRNLSSLNDSLLDGCISYVPGYITNGLVLDASIYDNNYVNSGLTSTNGLIGYGIQNSNADFANMSYAAATNYPYDLSNSWSADVWFKTTTPQSAYSTPLWSKQVGNSNDYALWLGIASSNQVLSISTESDGTLLGGLLNTQNAFTDNQWHYLAETYNLQTGTRTVFYDGSIVGTTNITLPVKYENQSITFGGVAATNVQTDEAHLWNRALSSNEIYSIFINGGTATPNTFIGTFTGNGSLLTNLNASNLTSGTLPDAAVSPNTMTNLYGTNTGPAVAYVANHTWAINTNTAAGATFYASTNGFIMSATAAVTNLAIITSPSGKTNFWQVSGYVQINSTVTDTAKMVVLYKDENNAWQSNGMSAVYSGTGANDVAAQGIWVQPSTPIYIVITLPTTGGTINYNAATHVEMKP